MSNKKRFLALVTGRDTQIIRDIKFRNKHREELKEWKREEIKRLQDEKRAL